MSRSSSGKVELNWEVYKRLHTEICCLFFLLFFISGWVHRRWKLIRRSRSLPTRAAFTRSSRGNSAILSVKALRQPWSTQCKVTSSNSFNLFRLKSERTHFKVQRKVCLSLAVPQYYAWFWYDKNQQSVIVSSIFILFRTKI